MFNRAYLRPLAHLFSSPAIRAMAGMRLPNGMAQLISDSGLSSELPGCMTNKTIFESIYSMLQQHYRCEYVYKNSIARKILLGRHKFAGATMATELRCDMSKADFVILNGTSTVYEIKTELDNLDRLPSQLNAYRKMFDKVMVVAPMELAESLWDTIDTDVGILAMTERGTFRQLRSSLCHATTVDPGCIFDSLRKSEYMPIVGRHFGPLPELPNTQHYSFCRELFVTLPPSLAHQEMVNALKNRFCPTVDRSLLERIPSSLTAGILSSQISAIQALALADFMECEYAPS